MKKMIISIFKWFIWKSFQKDMKNCIGYKSVKKLRNDLKYLEQEIRLKNNIPINQEIKWEILKEIELEESVKYVTYKHYLEKWEIIECFKIK